MINVLAVAIGGALGSLVRFGIQKWLNVSFPVGTFLVNFVGCFFAGWLWAKAVGGLNGPAYFFAMTGFCGGFTTFSAFSVENMQMIVSGNWLLPCFYILISIVGGLLATYLGYKIFST